MHFQSLVSSYRLYTNQSFDLGWRLTWAHKTSIHGANLQDLRSVEDPESHLRIQFYSYNVSLWGITLLFIFLSVSTETIWFGRTIIFTKSQWPSSVEISHQYLATRQQSKARKKETNKSYSPLPSNWNLINRYRNT